MTRISLPAYQPRIPTQIAIASVMGISVGLIGMAMADQGSKNLAIVAGIFILPVMMMVTRNAQRVLLFGIYLDTCLRIEKFFSCDTDNYLSTCGFHISLSFVFVVILYVLWLYDLRRNPAAPRPRLTISGGIGVAFLGALLLSLANAIQLTYSFYEIWLFFTVFLVFYYLVNHIHSKDDVLFFLYVFMFAMTVQVAVMELQGLGFLGVGRQGRINGTLGSPNFMGGMIAQSMAIVIAALFMKLPRRVKLYMSVLLVFAVHSIIGTQSRGGWTALLVAVLIIIVGGLWKRWLGPKMLVAILCAAAVFLVIFSAPINNRLYGDDNGSADSRGPLAEIAFNMIQAKPVLGVGINNFGFVLYDYIDLRQYGRWLNLVHNFWLLIWSETGTIGLILYVSFWLSAVVQAWRIIRRGDPFFGPLALGMVAGMCGAALHMINELYTGRALIQLVWVEVAMLNAMGFLSQQTQHRPAPLPVQHPAREAIVHHRIDELF
jgi:hypothetical protein